MTYTVRIALFLIFFSVLSVGVQAQLKLYGKIYSEGVVRATLDVEGESDTYFLYLNPKGETEWNGQIVKETKYKLPWPIGKNVNHTLKFTDGTVEKVVFVHGPVPEDIVPKQKFILDIDLTNPDNAGVMLVIFWSKKERAYVALPLDEMDKIKEQAYDASIWE
ncbi:MAG: hypothetical protein LC664_14890 [Flavobacteriales bacterium]|nr:hypothetical protein [Flavobacteriales bacterium]